MRELSSDTEACVAATYFSFYHQIARQLAKDMYVSAIQRPNNKMRFFQVRYE